MTFNSKYKRKFTELYIIDPVSNCWNWVGPFHPIGYGMYWDKNIHYYAHRYSYIKIYGKNVPKNMCLDHLCNNKKCVNPEHLEVVTSGENTRRYHKKNKITT